MRGFEGRRTACRSLRDGSTAYLSEEEAEDAAVVGNRSSAERALVVAEDRDVVEVLDPVSSGPSPHPGPPLSRPGRGMRSSFEAWGDLLILPPREGGGGEAILTSTTKLLN